MRMTPVIRTPLVLALSAIFIFVLVAACIEEPLDTDFGNGFGTETTPENGTPAVAQEFEGTVDNVDTAAGSLTITTADGETREVGVDQSTIVTINDSAGALADIQPGDSVEVQLDQFSDMAMSVTVERSEDTAQTPRQGTVADVDAESGLLVLTTGDGESQVVEINQSTVITVNGAEATLADIQPGDPVEVESDSSTEAAARVTVESGEGAAETAQQGTVESVDAGTGLLVLNSVSGEPVVLGVDQSTEITVNGSSGVLADIQPGDAVEVEVSESSDMATSVTVLTEATIDPAQPGTVESVDAEAGQMTVLLADGNTITVNVDQSTLITINKSEGDEDEGDGSASNGAAGTLEDIEAGDSVEVVLEEDGEVAASVAVVSQDAQEKTTWQGTVESVNEGSGTLVVLTTAGRSLRVGVDQSTVVTVNGSTGALADIQAGDAVQVQAQQGVDVAALVAAQRQQATDSGEVTGVNPVDQTMTVETDDNRVLQLRFLVVNGTTEVIIDGGRGTVLDLAQGAEVEVTYNPETMVVTTVHLKTNGGY